MFFQMPWTRRATREKRHNVIHDATLRGRDAIVGPSSGPIEKAFFANQGRIVHKWHHYLPIYDRYFGPYKGRPIRMLEIGVSKGGSLHLWRDFFGPSATIFGIDIDPACSACDGEAGQVRIGSQDDPEFLARTVAEMGGVDIVLDDGSHIPRHIVASFNILFPLVSEGGLYVVEDLHTNYWPRYEGGLRRSGTFIELTKKLIDDMHHWYHVGQITSPAAQNLVGALHVYDSMVVMEKQAVSPPTQSYKPAL